MSNRISHLQNIMRDNELHAVALNPSPNLVYLTGLDFHLFERPIVVIVPQDGDLIAVLPGFESGKLSSSASHITPFTYDDNPSSWGYAFQKAADYLDIKNPVIGLDPLHFRYLEYQFLSGAFLSAHIIPFGDQISSLRTCKDNSEIEKMEKAVSIAQLALNQLIPTIRLGQTEREIANRLSILLLQNGSDNDNQFTPIVASGPNSANPHHTPGERKINKGDALLIDWGARYQGYYSDLTRNIFLGNPPADYLQIYEAVRIGNQSGREHGRPGLPAGSIDQVTRQTIEARGYGPLFTHRTGHGLGMEEHEPIYIFSENTTPLQPGMVYTVEPGIYIPDRFGVRIEDDVVVTTDGCRSISDYSRDLIIIND